MDKRKKLQLKIAILINIFISIMTIVACIMMYTGYKFMPGYDFALEVAKTGMFRLFTVDSNILMGIVSLKFAIEEIKLLKGKRKDISSKLYIFKLMATTSVGLTFFTVVAYLGPISKGGIPSMLMNSNLFLHLIIPITSIVVFILFERNEKIKFKHVVLGVIPMLIYAVCYLTNILIHMENGKVSPRYDWYWFVQNGVWTAAIVVPIMIVITYVISLILWRCNKKRIEK